MNKKISDQLVKLFQEAVEKHGIDEWGILFVDGRWTVGFLKAHERYVGSGETPQEAYIKALHDISGTEAPPF